MTCNASTVNFFVHVKIDVAHTPFNNYIIIVIQFPAIIPIEQPIESNIDAGEFIFFQFQLPSNGMTIQLQQQRGSVTLYGSFDIQNPNSAFHSFRIESSGNVFVPLGDSGQSPTTDEGLSKRLVKRIISNRTLYVSIEGQQDFSSFILETTFGDTCKLLSYFI